MHKWYMTFLECLRIELFNQDWYETYHSKRFALKNKTMALVRFDREIILAQKMHDMSECVRNSPITGDSNDMSSKTIPTAVTLNGRVYFLDLSARNEKAPEVVVKQNDGTIKYKLELDTSEVDALLERIGAVIKKTELGESLSIASIQGEQATFEPQAFTLVNNGTINIAGATVDVEKAPMKCAGWELSFADDEMTLRDNNGIMRFRGKS